MMLDVLHIFLRTSSTEESFSILQLQTKLLQTLHQTTSTIFACATRNNEVFLYDTTKSEPFQKIPAPENVNALAFLTSTQLVVATGNTLLQIWDIQRREFIKSHNLHCHLPTLVVIGFHVVVYNYCSEIATVWNTRKNTNSQVHIETLESFDVQHFDENRFLVCTAECYIALYNVHTLLLEKEVRYASRDTCTVARWDDERVIYTSNGKIVRYNFEKGDIETFTIGYDDYSRGYTIVHLERIDEKRIAIVHLPSQNEQEKRCSIWNLEDEKIDVPELYTVETYNNDWLKLSGLLLFYYAKGAVHVFDTRKMIQTRTYSGSFNVENICLTVV